MGIRSGHGQSSFGDVAGELGTLTAHLACYAGWPAATAVLRELKDEEAHS